MALGDTRPQARPEDDRGFFERAKDDIGMAFTDPFGSREDRTQAMLDKGYDPTDVSRFMARTANTQNANTQNANTFGVDRGDGGGSMSEPMPPTPEELGPRVNNPAQQYRQALANRYMDQAQPAGSMLDAGPAVTPDMMGSALSVYESQRGAGQVPYQMAQYGLGSFQPQMQPGQYVSPAFQYAAQNYGRLGGSQRLMPRSMPMLSVAERQTVNDMASAMAQQPAARAQQAAALRDFTTAADVFSGSFSGKGGSQNRTQDVRRELAPLLGMFSRFV